MKSWAFRHRWSLPFGFFPLKQGKRTGLIFPRNYESSQRFGFGLKEIGWYFPINDQWDLKMTGDIYFKGTWAIHANARYKKRYKNKWKFKFECQFFPQ